MTSLLLRVLVLGFLAAGLCRSMTAHDDPPPTPPLSEIEGEWLGTLVYKDYQPPHARVSLPVVLKASLLGPGDIALHYVYDDGPGKVVHGYERLSLDLEKKTLVWSGRDEPDITRCEVTSAEREAGEWVIVADARKTEKGRLLAIRYRLRLSGSTLEIAKEEGFPPDILSFRNGYSFHRKP